MNDTSTLTIQGYTPYAQIPKWVIRSGNKLSHGAVRLYGAIMSYADNDKHIAFPGRERLAEDVGTKPRSISAYVKELEDFGALIVTRRRNKRTGNFYSNHYILVFQEPSAKYCTPPNAEDCTLTKPTIELDLPSVTSDSASDQQKPSSTSKDFLSRAATAEPRTSKPNPGNLTPAQRKRLRDKLIAVGQLLAEGYGFYDGTTQNAWDAFANELLRTVGQDRYDDRYADLIDNGKWTVSKKVATAYGAGKELNTLIATAGSL